MFYFTASINDLALKMQTDQNKEIKEATIISQLVHRNIIGYVEAFILEAFEPGLPELYCLKMEFAQNKTLKALKALIDTRGQLNLLESSYFIRQIFESLVYLKAQNIIHCDLKPDNILLAKNMLLKISDFGNSVSSVEKEKKTTTFVNIFTAPELTKGLPFSEATDVWAAGVILYKMLFNQYPFKIYELKDENIDYDVCVYEEEENEDVKEMLENILTEKSSRKSAEEPHPKKCWRKML